MNEQYGEEFQTDTPGFDEGSVIPRREFLKMAATVGGGALAMTQLGGLLASAAPKAAPKTTAPGAKPSPAPAKPLAYNAKTTIEAKNFDANFAQVEGISQNQLKQHLGLYQGYVKKINEIQAQLQAATPDVAKANATYDPFRELHVEQTYALNGVILHEQYFGNLGGDQKPPSERVKDVFGQEFGSWDAYINQLKALGKSMRGWAITGYNMRDGRIHNYGLDTHNQWVPVNVMPLLVLDVYEHAYMIDFGTNRGGYLDAFLANINWPVVDRRLAGVMAHHQAALLTLDI